MSRRKYLQQRSSRKDAADRWDRFAKRKRFWKSA
jgi:hypothetical protein